MVHNTHSNQFLFCRGNFSSYSSEAVFFLSFFQASVTKICHCAWHIFFNTIAKGCSLAFLAKQDLKHIVGKVLYLFWRNKRYSPFREATSKTNGSFLDYIIACISPYCAELTKYTVFLQSISLGFSVICGWAPPAVIVPLVCHGAQKLLSAPASAVSCRLFCFCRQEKTIRGSRKNDSCVHGKLCMAQAVLQMLVDNLRPLL